MDGRKALFADRYALAWGEEQVMPDAFLTGVVMLDAGLKQMDVGVLAFDQKGDNLAKVAQFKAAVEVQDLVESGSSFLLRGAFDDGQVQLAQAGAVQAAAGVHSQGATFPLNGAVRWSRSTSTTMAKKSRSRSKAARPGWPSPERGKKSCLMVRRQDASKLQYGVVLKVNGENTLYKDRLPAEQGPLWVLAPSSGPLEIRGYKVGVDRGEEFLHPVAAGIQAPGDERRHRRGHHHLDRVPRGESQVETAGHFLRGGRPGGAEPQRVSDRTATQPGRPTGPASRRCPGRRRAA